MKLLIIIAAGAILLSACGDSRAPNNPSAASGPDKVAISPMPDDIGLILQCNECSFRQQQEQRYLTGQVHNDAKQAITGYVLSVDLQDAQGNSVRKIDGLMLMEAMALQAGETKEFRELVSSDEDKVTQATVYFKKAGRDVKLSNSLVLKLQR